MKKTKMLLLEDDEGVREGLVHLLSKTYTVECAENGVEGLKKAIRGQPEVIMMDLKMPDMDGFQACKAFRNDREFDNVPIIILSAFNNVSERTKLFELGADDYITKPFDHQELLARIQRALERVNLKKSSSSKEIPSSPKLSFDQLHLDARSQEVTIDNKPISLSAIEFKLLHILVIYSNQLVERSAILDFVWEKQNVSPRLIDPHILSLRTKLNGLNLTIHSVYRKGYILKKL